MNAPFKQPDDREIIYGDIKLIPPITPITPMNSLYSSPDSEAHACIGKFAAIENF